VALFCRAENILAESRDHRVWPVRDARPDLRRIVLVARREPFSEYSVLAGIVLFAVAKYVRNQCGGYRVGWSVSPDRATTPYLRNADGQPEPVDWDTALQIFTLRFKAIQDKYGNDAIARLGTGQICTEELAFLGALAKFGMGILHGDGNTRQCMATVATAYKESFGFDAPPYTYKDFEESDVLVFVGSNLCIAHPIMLIVDDIRILVEAGGSARILASAPVRGNDGRE
jgi:anaerobic selenocysteine-containing dehydrogenase